MQQLPGAHNRIAQTAKMERKKKTQRVYSRPAAVPLDFHTFCAVHIVAFPVGSVILGVGGGSGLEILRVLGEFHSLGLGPRLVAELDQCHHHGQPQASHKDIEHASNIAQAQSARLVLRETSHAVSSAVRGRQTDRQTDNRLLCISPSWNSYTHGIQCLAHRPVLTSHPRSPRLHSSDCSVLHPVVGETPADSKAMRFFLDTDFPRPSVSQSKVA